MKRRPIASLRRLHLPRLRRPPVVTIVVHHAPATSDPAQWARSVAEDVKRAVR
jgi:hypothetical protein